MSLCSEKGNLTKICRVCTYGEGSPFCDCFFFFILDLGCHSCLKPPPSFVSRLLFVSTKMSTTSSSVSKSSMDSKSSYDSAPEYLEVHQVEVVDFAFQSQGDLQRKKSLSKKITMLVWNPRAKYTRRGKFSKWVDSN